MKEESGGRHFSDEKKLKPALSQMNLDHQARTSQEGWLAPALAFPIS
jgi:hypothetical protein